MDLPRINLETILELAAARGAREAELLHACHAGFSVTVQGGEVRDRGAHMGDILTVRTYGEDGRVGVATGPAAMPEALVDVALSASERAEPMEHAGVIGRLPRHSGGLGVLDRRYAQLDEESRVAVALDDERGARMNDGRVQTEPFTYRDALEKRAYANSRGISHEELGTRYWLTGAIRYLGSELALEGEFTSRVFSGVCSIPLGAQLARRAARLAEAEVGEVDADLIYLTPAVTCRLFAQLAPGFSIPNRVVDQVEVPALRMAPPLDPRIHLLDDGALPGAWNTRSFDDRGVPPVPLTLVKDGRVDRSYLSIVEARRDGTRPTGHARGEGIVPGNVVVRSGTRSVAAILSELGRAAFDVEHVAGDVALDLRTGELDLPVYGSIRTSKTSGPPLRGLRLRGNFIEALGRVIDVTGETDRWRHVDAPGILVEGLRLEREG